MSSTDDTAPGQVATLTRRAARDRAARKQAEDIAETKMRELYEANQKLEALTQDLEKTVASRTAEAEAARDEALAATRAKSDFLANMSHEIRTPLNAVIGMTGILLDTRLERQQREYANTIASSGEALLALINDILDFSKIEAGKLDLEDAPFDVRACIESVLDVTAPKAADKGLELVCEVDPLVPVAISGDITRTRQVLTNLLGNAVKFTDSGEIHLGVKYSSGPPGKPDERPPPTLHFIVRDTGLGIPPEAMSRLFQSFNQADSSTTRKFGGTGLGLAISRRLAEIMGGQVWAESEGVVGGGSRFHFTMVAVEAQAPPRQHLSGGRPSLRGARVLLVDDNDTNLRILKLQVRSWQMVPFTASSGADALAMLDEGLHVDCAVVDIQMPDMDGVTLARRIHARSATHDLDIVALSSIGWRVDDPQEGLFASHLTKPAKPSALHDVLAQTMSGSPTEEETTPTHVLFDESLGQQRPLRILLAEDNLVNQKVATSLLGKLGYSADIVNNGREAVAAVATKTYDLVLMDIQMPEMDGVTATRQIRERSDGDPAPRIVAMTANALTGDREKFLQQGLDDYVSKPIRIEELVRALRATPA